MTAQTDTVIVPRELEALVPGFLANRGKELAALRAAWAAGDRDALRQIGHRMKGAAASYGFERISEIGGCIESAAECGDAAALTAQIENYAAHLARLSVTYA